MHNLNSTEIRIAIVIPSYREDTALPTLLRQLSKKLTIEDAIIIVDDSPAPESAIIERKCKEATESSGAQFHFISCGIKSGRGHAIRRGMIFAMNCFEHLEFIIECDADGSHTVTDIIRLRDSKIQAHLLIGSRYLAGSQIIGWPISRRVFSLLLNKMIPKLLSINITDITNGLRRYSTIATSNILDVPQENIGFIYLTEQAIILNEAKLNYAEVPVTFINRTEGKSTVTILEIFRSMQGIHKLIKKSRR